MSKSNAPVSNIETPNVQRIKFIGFILVIGLVWNFSSSLLVGGWVSASLICAIVISLCVYYIWFNHDELFGRWLILGLVAGGVELLADCWLVQNTGTLVYVKGGPFIACSPLYMPFAWTVVLIELGYIGYWLSQYFGLISGSLLIAVLGAINMPLYAQWANDSQWWFYQSTLLLGNTPVYIILAESLIFLPLPWLFRLLEKKAWKWSFICGTLQGFWMWGCYFLSFNTLSLLG